MIVALCLHLVVDLTFPPLSLSVRRLQARRHSQYQIYGDQLNGPLALAGVF
jgi:hypothetical protein